MDVVPSRSELALLRRAARERWGVPDAVKTEALHTALQFLSSTDERKQAAALRFLAVIDRIDQADDRLDLERSKLATPTEVQARDVWDDVVAAIDRESQTSPGVAPGPPGELPTPDPRPGAVE